ncbi:MAG: hypothetical protein HYR79_04460 [Nitrospirae bacterium]|nr:hypothetical protein [Nitrospirota bacterium]
MTGKEGMYRIMESLLYFINRQSIKRKLSKLFFLLGFLAISLFSIMDSYADDDFFTNIQSSSSIFPDGIDNRGKTSIAGIFTGTLEHNIPIETPPGRNGMAPNLNLTYRSNNGDGWVGFGWELEVGSIERNTRLGLDYASTSTDFVLRMPGMSGEIVPVSNGEYHALIEDGQFYRIRPLTQEWSGFRISGLLPVWRDKSEAHCFHRRSS